MGLGETIPELLSGLSGGGHEDAAISCGNKIAFDR